MLGSQKTAFWIVKLRLFFRPFKEILLKLCAEFMSKSVQTERKTVLLIKFFFSFLLCGSPCLRHMIRIAKKGFGKEQGPDDIQYMVLILFK